MVPDTRWSLDVDEVIGAAEEEMKLKHACRDGTCKADFAYSPDLSGLVFYSPFHAVYEL